MRSDYVSRLPAACVPPPVTWCACRRPSQHVACSAARKKKPPRIGSGRLKKYKLIINATALIDADSTLNITPAVLAKVNELYAADKKAVKK